MPIQKKYCGLKEPLPQGYTQYADRYTCLRKGVGIGKNLPKNGQVRAPSTSTRIAIYNRLYIIFMVLLVVVNIILIIWIFMSPKHDEKEQQ
jgi:hypothetical protein